MKQAILDLGTNTFHIWIVDISENELQTLYSEKVPVKIGAGGIEKNKIALDAEKRILDTFEHFSTLFKKYKILPQSVSAFATSAFRSAQNGKEIQKRIFQNFNISIQIIDGEQEAEWIYEGVKNALEIGEQKALIMDIGGGSVEFIIGNQEKFFWKQSFEIGAQRLLDRFFQSDPIAETDILRQQEYLQEQLIDLIGAVQKFVPVQFIGSSGTFDTLVEMDFQRKGLDFQRLLPQKTEFELSYDDFLISYNTIVQNTRKERLKIPGMLPMRVDMIVVASILLKFILDSFNFQEIRISMHSLKEGILFSKPLTSF